MPDYVVKVQYSYPVQAINAEDALSTVPYVVKARFAGFHGEGTVEISDADTKIIVLTARLNTKKEPGNTQSHTRRTGGYG